MRSAVAIALIVGALSITSGLVSATPLAFLSRDMSAAASRASPRLCPPLQALRHRSAPLHLQCYPYWRPYHYYYWQHYYAYGGPLF